MDIKKGLIFFLILIGGCLQARENGAERGGGGTFRERFFRSLRHYIATHDCRITEEMLEELNVVILPADPDKKVEATAEEKRQVKEYFRSQLLKFIEDNPSIKMTKGEVDQLLLTVENSWPKDSNGDPQEAVNIRGTGRIELSFEALKDHLDNKREIGAFAYHEAKRALGLGEDFNFENSNQLALNRQERLDASSKVGRLSYSPLDHFLKKTKKAHERIYSKWMANIEYNARPMAANAPLAIMTKGFHIDGDTYVVAAVIGDSEMKSRLAKSNTQILLFEEGLRQMHQLYSVFLDEVALALYRELKSEDGISQEESRRLAKLIKDAYHEISLGPTELIALDPTNPQVVVNDYFSRLERFYGNGERLMGRPVFRVWKN